LAAPQGQNGAAREALAWALQVDPERTALPTRIPDEAKVDASLTGADASVKVRA
jgi:hypothetical protein